MAGSRRRQPDDTFRQRKPRRGAVWSVWWSLCTLLLACLLLVPQPARATDAINPWRPLERQWFATTGMAEGLPHALTTSLAQDRDGLLWIGTMGGLVRYDGYRMQVFDPAGDAAGLPDTYVRCLLALPDGSLLIGTNAGGLARFDPQTNRFRTYPVGHGGVGNRKIYALSKDGEQGVWIATDGGLDRLDLGSDRIESVDTGAQTSPRDFAVYQDRAGNVWLGNNNGLFVRRAGQRSFVRPDRPAGVVNQVLRDEIWAIREDAEGRLWVGSVQAGTVYRDPSGQWHALPAYTGYTAPARQATVRDFLEVEPGRMWIATDGDGILAYTPGDPQVQVLRHDFSRLSSLPGDSVRALLLDRSGNVWAATDLGVARSNARPEIAASLQPSSDAEHSLADSNVNSITVDARGRAWLGMGSGRVDIVELATGTIRHLRMAGSQLHRDVRCLAIAPDGSIWVGTPRLARIDPATLAIQDAVLPELGDSPVLSLLRYGPYMLVGTYNGVYRYDTRSGDLVHYRHVAGQADSLADDTVRQIVRVGDSIWYGTGRGLSIARNPLQTGDFVNLAHRDGDATSLPQNLVDSIDVDARGRVWVGTLGGLGMLPDAGAPYRFRNFGIAEGLASDKINAVQAADDGNLWVSTSNGLSVIDGHSLRVRNLGARDGQHVSSYIYASDARMPDGTLLFGGAEGLTVIRPQLPPADDPQAPLRVTNLQVDGRQTPFGALPGDHGQLDLAEHDRNLRVDFALLDYQAPQETRYSYRMAGFDNAWIDIPKGSAPSAVYTNLPHGRYTLELRAEPRGLHARVVKSSLSVVVAPFWYETLPARILALALLLLLVALLVQLRTHFLRLRATQLQLQIDEHTRDLLAANRRLDRLAGTDELTGINNRRRFLELAEAVRRDAGSQPSCLALLDLDRFKRVNDEHGHLAGDEVLHAVAASICRQLRSGELVGRYGGEELVICLPCTSGEEAMAIAERIRVAVRLTKVRYEGRVIAATISSGVAELRPGESMTSWLGRADAALYESKRNGRDRSTLAG